MCINLLSQCSYLHLSLSWLRSFGNSLTHQYKSVSALPTVRCTTILATLYMFVKILRVFMVSPLISPIPISPKMPFTCPEYLIEYSWHGENFSLRLFDLFVKTSTSISLYCSVHVRQCFSRKRQVTLPFACQQNICISICQAPEKLQFACGSITHAGAVALPTPYSLLPTSPHAPAVATRRRRRSGHLMCHI